MLFSNYLFPESSIYAIEKDSIKVREIKDPLEVENLEEELLLASNYEIKRIYGFMGFIRIYDVTFICLITESREVGEIIPGQPINLIERVKLYPVQVSVIGILCNL